MLYCKYHDVVLCEKHKNNCLGGARCEPRDAERFPARLYGHELKCSVCAGVIEEKKQ